MLCDAAARIGEAYYQDFYEGEAEDNAEVVRLGDTVTVAAGAFDDVLVTREWNRFGVGNDAAAHGQRLVDLFLRDDSGTRLVFGRRGLLADVPSGATTCCSSMGCVVCSVRCLPHPALLGMRLAAIGSRPGGEMPVARPP